MWSPADNKSNRMYASQTGHGKQEQPVNKHLVHCLISSSSVSHRHISFCTGERETHKRLSPDHLSLPHPLPLLLLVGGGTSSTVTWGGRNPGVAKERRNGGRRREREGEGGRGREREGEGGRGCEEELRWGAAGRPAMQASSCACSSVMFLSLMMTLPLMSASTSPANAHTCTPGHSHAPSGIGVDLFQTNLTSSLNQLRQWQRDKQTLCLFTRGRSSKTSLFSSSLVHITTGAPG